MTKNEYKLQYMTGNVAILDPESREIVNQTAEYVREIIEDAGEFRNLVFLALALVSAEQMVALEKPKQQGSK